MLAKWLLVAVAVALFARWLWSRRGLYRLSWHLNGKTAYPIVGHILSFINHDDILNVISKMLTDHPSPTGLWLGPQFFVVLDHPVDIETVLTSPHCMDKADIYQMVRQVLETDGLVSNHGAVWRRHRKLIAQGFSESVVTSYMDMFNEHIGALVASVGKLVGGGPFNLKKHSNYYLMNTILETTLGQDVESQDKHTYEQFFSDAQNLVSKMVYQPWYQIDWFFRFTKWPAVQRNFNILHNRIFDKLIQQRLEQGCDRLTLLDKLLRIKEEMDNISISEIKGECNTIMMAGSDTSALTVSTCLLLLAMHPECQQRVYDEVSTVLGHTRDTSFTREQVDRLPYTERCIRETMRFVPIVPMIARTNRKPVKLRSVELPAGTQIAIAITKLHQSAEHWGDDVADFDPDRFEPERLAKVHPFAYLAFSGGPRNCIGYKYAIVIVKLAVARLVHSFHLSTPLCKQDIRYTVDINVRFLMEHLVEVRRRSS